MRGRLIDFDNGDAKFSAYLSPSASGAGPGVVVIQEWWGLVPHILDVCDRFAGEGFTALAPDLYGKKTTTDPDEAATLMQALHIGQTEQILRKAILALMANEATSPNDRVGVVGFCMGGQLAMYAAANNPVVRATVNFYGIHPKVVPSYRDLNGPVLGIFAENDKSASPDAVEKLHEELTLLRKPHDFKTYPGTQHAFFNDARPEVYDRAAAEDAWRRTLAFLRENLAA